jgi:hypothetical protein
MESKKQKEEEMDSETQFDSSTLKWCQIKMYSKTVICKNICIEFWKKNAKIHQKESNGWTKLKKKKKKKKKMSRFQKGPYINKNIKVNWNV